MNTRHDTIFEWFDRLAFLLALVVVPLLVAAYFLAPSVSWLSPMVIAFVQGISLNFITTLTAAIVFYLLLRRPGQIRARQAEARLTRKTADEFMARLGNVPSLITEIVKTVTASDHVITHRIKPFFDRFSPGHPQHGFYELMWKYLLRGLGRIQDEQTLIVDYTTAHTLWRDALVESDSWDAMSYALDLWQNLARDISRAHQEAHVKLGGSIRRVFVVSSEDELPDVLSIMREQSTYMSKDSLRWIYRKKLEVLARDRLGINDLDLLDFSLVDGKSFVLWFRLDEETQRPKDAVLTIQHDILRRGRAVFDLAFAEGCRLEVVSNTP